MEALNSTEVPATQNAPPSEIPIQETQNDKIGASTDLLPGKMDLLVDMVKELQSEFQHKIKYDESKERIINRLHEQLQEHRSDLHLKLIRPLVMGLIGLYDDLHSLINQSTAPLEIDQQKTLLSFGESIEELLAQNGVETFTLPEPNFVPRHQRSIHTVPTSEIDQDKLVAKRIRKGFRYEEKILRPEIVATYQYIQSSSDSAQSLNEEEGTT
jgi:molecular chaperone GrpE